MDCKISFVAPAYNEALGIEMVVKRWIQFCQTLPYPAEIVITNDGSTDGTREVLERLARGCAFLHIIHTSKNRGYGAALCSSIANSRGEWVVTLDSDGQFCIDDFPVLYAATTKSTRVCVTGIRRKEDSFIRVAADRILRLLCRCLFGTRASDPNCALKLCPGDAIRSLILESTGFSSPSEILFKMRALGFTPVEVPVRHLPRVAGSSKLNVAKAGFQILMFLIYLRLKLFLFHRGILYLTSEKPTLTQPAQEKRRA